MASASESAWKIGNSFPYDADDSGNAVPPVDWAHMAARGVLADLTDRRGVKNGFSDVDPEVRSEIVASLAEIIRFAAKVRLMDATTCQAVSTTTESVAPTESSA